MEMTSRHGAQVEPVNGDVPPSTGRKGKRNLVSDDDLQPTPKKTYNLRSRKPKLSEEEVATRTPLSNRRTGKRLAESDSSFEVTSKKSYYSRKKTSTLSEEEVSKDSQEGKGIVNEEIEDMKRSLETDTNGFKEFMGDMVSEEEKQNVGGGTEDSKENSKVTITIEETKEEMGIQKGMESTDGKKLQNMEEILEMSAKACAVNDKGQLVSIKEEQSVAEEIKDMRESLEAVTNITVEETKEDLGIQRGNVEELLEISTKASTVNDEGQLVSEEEKQNVGEEIQDIIGTLKGTITTEETKEELEIQKGTESTDRKKLQNMEETLEMSAKASAGNDEGQLVSNKEDQSVADEIEDVKESLEVATNITVKDTKEELVSEEEKQNVGEEIEDIIENSNVTIITEETKEELGIQEGTESTGGKNLQNTEETLEMSAEACAVSDEGQLEIQRGNVEEPLEIGTKASAVNDEGQLEIQRGNVEEPLEIGTKASAVNDDGQLVAEEEKQNVGEEIEDIIENSNVTITTEETNEELGIGKGTESTVGKNLQNTEETLEMSAEGCAVSDEGQLVSEEEIQNVGEEIEDIIENSNVTITTEETKEELGTEKGTESTGGKNLQNTEETLEMSAEACAVSDEGQLVSEKETQNVGEEIEDIIENSNVTITTEETKEELGIEKGTESTGGKNLQNTEETLEMSAEACAVSDKGQLMKEIQRGNVEEPWEIGTKASAVNDEGQLVSEEEKQNVGEEIEDIIENSKVTITTEETNEELGIQKGKESTGGQNLQNTEETFEMSAEACDVNDEGQLVSNKEEQSVAEEIEDVKESLEVVTNITVEETKEELVSHKVNKSLDEEVGNANTILVKCATSFLEKSVAELCSTEVKEYINEETTDMEESSAKVNTEIVDEEANKYLGSQEESKGMDEDTEDMNAPCDEVKGQLASHEGRTIDEEMKDVVESCELSRSGCTTSFAPIPKTPVATRSKIPKTPVATRSKILFMGNLPYSVDRKTVLSFFEDVGNVVDIRMAKNADGSMKGFCHVTFATAAAAVKALEKNGQIFHNRNVKLDLAENLSNKHVLGSTVLVRGLERSQPEEDIQKSLMKHFGDCGSIQNINIPKDIQAGDTRRVAFIRFEDSEAVSKAVKLCGSELGDSKLFVKEVGRSRFRRKSSNAKRRNSKRQVPSKTNQ